MKTAVVFYSYDGSTRVAAKLLADRFGAQLFELEEVKKRGRSPLSFIAAGFSASIGRSSSIKDNFAGSMKEYDSIYVGTPIWAGKAAPAVNSFIRSLDVKGKDIVIFTLQADPNPEASPSKSADNFKAALERKGAKAVKVARFHGAAPGKTAAAEDIKKQIDFKL
jgi:flavodoxin